MIKCVVFDLDGTLVNTIDDLANACKYLLKKYNSKYSWTIEDYTEFVGNGAKNLVSRTFDNSLNEEDLNSRYEEFKVVYNKIKCENAYIYEGINEIISFLKQKGYLIAICTNKPNIAATEMVDALFGKNIFDMIVGATDDCPKKPDIAMVSKILDKFNLNKDEIVWVGDSDVDILSAKNIGCKSIAVTWGYRSEELLNSYNPDYLLKTPNELLKIF